MTAADRFRSAVERRDLSALDELFHDDIRLYSPVKFTPFEGKPMVLGLFGVLLRAFEDFHYVGTLDGTVETSADGTEAPSTCSVPPWAARASTASTCCRSTRRAWSRSSP